MYWFGWIFKQFWKSQHGLLATYWSLGAMREGSKLGSERSSSGGSVSGRGALNGWRNQKAKSHQTFKASSYPERRYVSPKMSAGSQPVGKHLLTPFWFCFNDYLHGSLSNEKIQNVRLLHYWLLKVDKQPLLLSNLGGPVCLKKLSAGTLGALPAVWLCHAKSYVYCFGHILELSDITHV